MLLSDSQGELVSAEEAQEYGSLVGTLLYLGNCTRPDISFAAGALARYLTAPTTVHFTAAMGVARYVSTTADYGLICKGGELKIEGYCDADFAGDTDTRRSTTGYVFSSRTARPCHGQASGSPS